MTTKQLAIAGILGLGLLGAQAYVNDGYVSGAPQIDDPVFVNNGTFYASTLESYYTYNTLYYTNRNLMNGSPGFRFDFVPYTVGSERRMAANFYNAGFGPNEANASVTASTELIISATNILSRGSLNVGSSGFLGIHGMNVDLGRGIITSVDALAGPQQRMTDQYWSFGTNAINPVVNVTLPNPTTPPHQVISHGSVTGLGTGYLTNAANILSLIDYGLTTNSSVTAVQAVRENGSNRTVQVVFVRTNPLNPNTNLNVKVNILGGSPTTLGTPVVEWSSVGALATNYLYLTDNFGINQTNAYVTNFPFAPVGSALRVPPFTYRPVNYSFLLTRTPLYTFTAATPYTNHPAAFWGNPPGASNLYSAYSVNIDPTIIDGRYPERSRTAPGRVDVVADRSMNFNLARVESPTYLKIQASNHLQSADNAIVSAPYVDLALASTNGQLNVPGLWSKALPRIYGLVSCYSAVWTNTVDVNGATNPVTFHVLYVDSQLETELPIQTLDVSLKSTNLTVDAQLNALFGLNIDAERFTVLSNGLIGVPFDLSWPVLAPRIRALTNFGYISGSGELDFNGLASNGTGVAYQDFVNAGTVYGAGLSVTANNLVNSGFMQALYGPVSIQSSSNVVLEPGGSLYSFDSDVGIEAANLYVTNHFILPGRSLSLSVTNHLESGPNSWNVYAGFNLWRKPATGDLAETMIYDNGFAYAEVLHSWAGLDRGPTEAGFTNNAAVGQVILDGDTFTLFTLSGTGGAASNAIYIDHLMLANQAGTFDAQGGLSELNISPGMTVYYAQATINGASVAEFLDGKHNGQLRWVSSHAGPFSGVLVTLPNGAMTNVNAALLASCNVDSDGDGNPNCNDTTPFGDLSPIQPILSARAVSSPAPGIALSWSSVGGSLNRLYSAANSASPQWQLVTNAVCTAPIGQPSTMEIVVPANGVSRFYRVGVEPVVP